VPASPDNPEIDRLQGESDSARVATGRRRPGPEQGAVGLDALAAAIDTARATGDHGVLDDEPAVQGFRRPWRSQPTCEQIMANVDIDPVTGC
jgi:hypothetical protein